MNVAKQTLKPLTWLFESGVENEDDLSESSESVFDFLDEDEEKENSGDLLATRVNRGVSIWRSLVLLMLLAAGATTSILAFYILRDEEDEDFEVSVSAIFVGGLQGLRPSHLT